MNKSFESFKAIIKDNPVKLGNMIVLKKEDCLCNGCILSHPIILKAVEEHLKLLGENKQKFIDYSPIEIEEWDIIIPPK